MIPASMLRDLRACRANETCSYQLQRHPCSHPTFRPNGALAEARVRRPSGMRHEDGLVCSPGYYVREGATTMVRIARDPDRWRW